MEDKKDLGADAAAVVNAGSIGSDPPQALPDRLVRLTREDDYEKRWIVVGANGAVDFHCSHLASELTRRYGRTGGIEYHHRGPTEYMNDDALKHEHCWVLGAACWADGTSSWASDHWIPMFQACGEDWVWRELESTYRTHEWPTPRPVSVQPQQETVAPSVADTAPK